MPFLVSAAAVLVVVLVTFAIGVSIGKHRVVDVAWGVGFAAVAVAVWPSWLLVLLTVLWGLRLAVHIGLRGRGHPEDPRYEELLSKARGNRTWYALRMVYLLQGASIWFISLPLQVAAYTHWKLTLWVLPGVVVWAVGLLFETVGDWQLSRFRAAGRPGGVLDTGLWRYTRHPNYFGDACVWWGLFGVTVVSWPVVFTVLSPVLMTWLLTRKTGKPLMEAHMARSRPGYAAYVARTSGFFPWPPRGE